MSALAIRFASAIWRNKLAILGIFGVTLVQTVYGTIFSTGNMSPYLTSYLRFKTSSSTITYTKSIWIFTAGKSAMGMFAIAGGVLSKLIHPRLVIIIGSLCMCSASALTAWLIQYGFTSTLLTYGLLQGFGVGLGYPVCLKYAQLWLPAYNGLVTGIVMAGFGIGSFVVNFVQVAMINPDNLPADYEFDGDMYFDQDEVLDNVPRCLYILSIVYAVCIAFGMCLMPKNKSFDCPNELASKSTEEVIITDPTTKNVQAPECGSQHCSTPSGSCSHESGEEYGSNLNDSCESESSLNPELTNGTASLVLVPTSHPKSSGREYTPMECLKTPAFWAALFGVSMNEYVLIVIQNYYKTYGETFLNDDAYLSLVGSMSAVGNAVGRITWGILFDRTTYKSSMIALCGFQGLIAVSMPLSTQLGTGFFCKAFYLTWVALMFANSGGVYVLTPSSVGRAFGMQNFGVNYGIIYCAGGLMGIVFTEITSAVLDNTTGWATVFVVGGATSWISQLTTFMWTIRDLNGNFI